MDCKCFKCQDDIRHLELTNIDDENNIICTRCSSLGSLRKATYHHYRSRGFLWSFLFRLVFVIVGILVFNELRQLNHDEFTLMLLISLIIVVPYYKFIYRVAFQGNWELSVFFIPDNLPSYEVTTTYYRGGQYAGQETHTEYRGGTLGAILGVALVVGRLILGYILVLVLTFATIVAIIPYQIIMSIVHAFKAGHYYRRLYKKFHRNHHRYVLVVKQYEPIMATLIQRMSKRVKLDIYQTENSSDHIIYAHGKLRRVIKVMRKVHHQHAKHGILFVDYCLVGVFTVAN
ncbi:MAG TPA: hypothetical protein PK340_03300 [Bacilli bacterium]|nr:hypothetical protein [Bacilli bacterium]